MAAVAHILHVFFASPSDVEDEREAARRVLDELNLTWGDMLSVRLELLHWSTHATPGVGSDPQAVINADIPDYDIFIAVLCSRLGTPTPRANSGTEEEFDRALSKFRRDP